MRKQLYKIRASGTTTKLELYVVGSNKKEAADKAKKIYPRLYIRITEELGEVIL